MTTENAEEPDVNGWSETSDAVTQPPEGTQITIERFADGVTIQVPAAGVWKGSRGLFAVAILWNAIVGGISLCLIGPLIGLAQAQGQGPGWIGALVMSLFWLVGLGILLGAINMGQRRAALAVTGGSLLVLQTGLFGSKRKTWETGEVEAVRPGPSGMEVNEVPVLELQVFDGGGKFGLLAGRSNQELEWLASELRTALKVGKQLK